MQNNSLAVARVFCCLLFCAAMAANAQTTNRWTKLGSGNWEEPYWSLGVLPSAAQGAIEFNNTGFKALAISYNTAANYPASLQIQNLLVAAPTNSSNLLLLNYAGVSTPLSISHDLRISPGGALLSYASGLRADRFILDGTATFAEQAESEFNSVLAGSNALAEVDLSNATFVAGNIELGGGNQGTFNQTAGLNSVSNLTLWDRGIYNLTNGTLFSSYVTVGEPRGVALMGRGELNQYGGSHTNTDTIEVLGDVRRGSYFGNLALKGGRLEGRALMVSGGGYQQSGGTNRTLEFSIAATGHGTMDGGLLQVSNALVGYSAVSFASSTMVQNGGAVQFADTLTLTAGGSYTFVGGSFSVSNIVLGYQGRLGRGTVSFVNSGLFSFSGGTFAAGSGSNGLGQLSVSATSAIDLESGGASVLRFRDSHTVVWGGGTLLIRKWAGFYGGGGPDQVYVGASASGLTASQLAKITFENPAGITAGNYPAKILPTGELVPSIGRPVLSSTRTAQGMTLSWDSSTSELYSSADVTGPYTRINPQPSSPYTVGFAQARRFFELRQLP